MNDNINTDTTNTTVPAPKEPSPARLIATLSLAGLLSGLIIVGVYELTLPTILAHQAKMLRQAVLKVLPGAVSAQRLAWRDGKFVADEKGPKDEPAIFEAFAADGKRIGYAIPGAGPGFQDIISLLYGYRPQEERIVGMQILDSRETPGLGDKIYKDPAFQANFRSLAIKPEGKEGVIKTVKKGTKSAPHEVDAITGATISSKAVVRIINETNDIWLSRLPATE